MPRFLLRDGHAVMAEINPDGLDVFAYTDQKGQKSFALATVKAEKAFFRQVPLRLLPLKTRMDQALARSTHQA